MSLQVIYIPGEIVKVAFDWVTLISEYDSKRTKNKIYPEESTLQKINLIH
jgi:hypothetical protein